MIEYLTIHQCILSSFVISEEITNTSLINGGCCSINTNKLGTTKLVIIGLKSIRSNLIGSLDIFKNINFYNEKYISFLPLSHSYEHTAGQFMPLLTSSEIFYAENMDKLFTNFKEVNPTYIAAVPRFYEAIY